MMLFGTTYLIFNSGQQIQDAHKELLLAAGDCERFHWHSLADKEKNDWKVS